MSTYSLTTRWRRFELRRGVVWALIMVLALVAFELFNFSTTEYALGTFFGAHDTLGLASWATVLAMAFCGIDFAGLSRLFTRQTEWRKEPKEVWLLTGTWFLGALMNAVMTWWAVASALAENPVLGNELVTREQILTIVPLFVAVLVWLARVMLIGSIAAAGDRFFSGQRQSRATAGARSRTITPSARPVSAPDTAHLAPLPEPRPVTTSRFAEPARLKPAPEPAQTALWGSNGGGGNMARRASSVRSYPSPARARAADEPRPTPRRYDQESPARPPRPAQPAAHSARQPAARRVSTPSARQNDLPSRETPVSTRANEPAPPNNELVYVDIE